MHGTTPPEPPQGTRTHRDESPLATLPLPGNAELVLYLLVVLVIGIVTLVSDQLGAGLAAARARRRGSPWRSRG